MARISVKFEDALLEEMRAIVPMRQRNTFIEGAVRSQLAQLRQIRAVEATAGAWNGEGRREPTQEIEQSGAPGRSGNSAHIRDTKGSTK
jgi:hypothetical protein